MTKKRWRPSRGRSNTIDDILERLFIEEGGCFTWRGAATCGYGAVSFRGKQVRAHRVVYEHFRGAIDEGKQLHHICGNPSCCNPWHLQVVDAREHTYLDGAPAIARRKTHCKRGHPLIGDNLYIRTEGRRQCRACRLEQWHQWKQRQRV